MEPETSTEALSQDERDRRGRSKFHVCRRPDEGGLARHKSVPPSGTTNIQNRNNGTEDESVCADSYWKQHPDMPR